MQIVPGILTDNKEKFSEHFLSLVNSVEYIQIDILDKTLFPQSTVALSDLDAEIVSQGKIEVHLMVDDPIQYLNDCQRLGINRIIFHIEAKNINTSLVSKILQTGIEPAIAINPQTPIGQLADYLNLVKTVLIMSVEPGKQGNPFLPQVLDKCQALKTFNSKLTIGIDGGVKEDNIQLVKSKGFDYAVVGSGIFGQKDRVLAYQTLTNMIK